jgi:hypothetical protein
MAYVNPVPNVKPVVVGNPLPPGYTGGVVVETHPNKYINYPSTGGVLLSSHPVIYGAPSSGNGNGNTQNGING